MARQFNGLTKNLKVSPKLRRWVAVVRFDRPAGSGYNLRLSLGTVAQSVEQRTFNPLVASSNLARPTSKIKGLRENVAFFYW